MNLADSHLEKVVRSLLGKASKDKCGHRMPLFELSELKAKDMFAEITSESTSISWSVTATVTVTAVQPAVPCAPL